MHANSAGVNTKRTELQEGGCGFWKKNTEEKNKVRQQLPKVPGWRAAERKPGADCLQLTDSLQTVPREVTDLLSTAVSGPGQPHLAVPRR